MILNDLEGGHVETEVLSISDLQGLRARYSQYLEDTSVYDPRRGFVEDWIEDLDGEIDRLTNNNQEDQ